MIVNSGNFFLYGISPKTVITRLTKSAKKGDTVINVDDCTDWTKNLCDRPWSVWNDMRYFKTKRFHYFTKSDL